MQHNFGLVYNLIQSFFLWQANLFHSILVIVIVMVMLVLVIQSLGHLLGFPFHWTIDKFLYDSK